MGTSMQISHRLPSIRNPKAWIAAAACTGFCVVLAGCGTAAFTPDAAVPVPITISGHAQGGNQPINGGSVKLYATAATGTATGGIYVGSATLLGSGTTGSDGIFTITGATACSAPNMMYVTVSGGNSGGYGTNNNTLLMATAGTCPSGATNNFTWVNEITTVAAAYALSSFTSITGTAPNYTVNVTADSTNYNGSSGTGTTAGAAGLAHAMLNAANLANMTTGVANTTTATTGNLGIVPQAEIDVLANALQACVNSAGGSAPGGVSNGSLCGNLFAATPSAAGTYPTNTLQAMLNLAKNPFTSTANNTAIFSLVSAAGAAFSPVLTGAPGDWTLSIVYKGTGVGIVYPYWLALDANDTMYLENTSASTSTYLKIISMSSSGVLNSPAGGFVPSNSTTAIVPRGIAPDSLGNLWIVNNGATTALSQVNEYSASAGTLTASYPATGVTGSMWGLAIDKLNNLWLTYVQASNGNMDELKYSAGTSTGGTYAFATGGTAADGAYQQASNGLYQPAIDAKQNIWAPGYYNLGTTVATLANTGTSSSPAYSANSIINTTTTGSDTRPFAIAFDSSGNAWATLLGTTTGSATTGLMELVPNSATATFTSATPGTLITSPGFSQPEGVAMDGNNVLWIADNGASTQGLTAYNTVSGAALSPVNGFKSCLVVSNACGATTAAAIYNPRFPAIDSAGSVWAGISGVGVTQMIGTATPAWPLLAEGKPGVMP